MTRGSTHRPAAGALWALVVLALAGCEPNGEGALTASVEGPLTGAVVVEVTGTGVLGFEDAGDVRTFSGAVDPRATTHRVIAVSASGQRIRFRVRVEELEAPPPRATVVAASDLDDAPIESLGGYSVRIAR